MVPSDPNDIMLVPSHSIQLSHVFLTDQIVLIIVFNKIDLFKAKLLTSPIKNRFPDYEGDNSYESAAKFIHRNFLQLCRDPNKDIITHFTCATDSQRKSNNKYTSKSLNVPTN